MRIPAAAFLASLALGCSPALAVVSEVEPIDGPSSEISEVADAAMSEDGTGGLVYLKRVGGRDHVFAAAFRGGKWQAPQRIDVGQQFDSSWPRIGAGDRGRLLVTWVQELGVDADRMFSATLDPGSTGFQDPVPVDFNVGEATSTYPDLDMTRGGQAYLVYRVVTDTSPANPPGYVGADVRLARYGSRLWSVLGSPIDRNVAMPVRAPSADNAPEIAIDLQGQAIVAWHEPGDDFVDRVWARRVFGAQVGIPLQVSPSTYDGAPLRGPADAFSLDVAGFGQGAIAFRQQPGQSGRLGATRIFVNEIPDVFAETSGAFDGARLADGMARAAPGPPSVAVDPQSAFATGFSSGATALLGAGDYTSGRAVERLDETGGATGAEPLVDLAESGAAVTTWRDLSDGGQVGLQERRADGVTEPTTLSAPGGGAVDDLVLAGSGLGDAIVAWRQGSGSGTRVAAAVVDAPPDSFLVLLPDGWQRKRRIPIHWDRALSAIGGVTYSISVDDEPVVENVRGLRARLSRDDIGGGRHTIQVFAIDSAGQETGSLTGRLRVDRARPRVRLRRSGRTVTVTVGDGAKRTASGLRPKSVRVLTGDGRTARLGRKRRRGPTAYVRHTYSSPGTYRLSVRARDRAGNRVDVRRRIRIP